MKLTILAFRWGQNENDKPNDHIWFGALVETTVDQSQNQISLRGNEQTIHILYKTGDYNLAHIIGSITEFVEQNHHLQ